MIRKENFCTILSALVAQIEKDRLLTEAIATFSNGHSVCTHTDELQEAIIEALASELRDIETPSAGTLISCWLYEWECGRSKDAWCRIAGVKYVLNTPEQLYNFLEGTMD